MSPSWSPGYDSVSPMSLCIYIFSYVGAYQLGLDVAIMKSWLRQCVTNESVYIYFQLCWSLSAWFRCRHHEVLVTTVCHQWVCVYIFSVMLEPISLVKMSPSWSPGYDSVSPMSLCIYIFSYVGSPPAWFRCRFHEVLVTSVYHQRVCVYIFSVMLGAHQLGLDVAFMKSWLRQCITNESVYIYFQLCWNPSAWFRCRHHEVLVTTVYHQWVCVYIFSVMLEPISLV